MTEITLIVPRLSFMEKRDATRLRNLLRNNRDAWITNRANLLRHIPIEDHIEAVDEAIKTIFFSARIKED